MVNEAIKEEKEGRKMQRGGGRETKRMEKGQSEREKGEGGREGEGEC